MFPDAEGWENMDPDEVAKWGVGSQFPPGTAEQSQEGVGPTSGMHTGINIPNLRHQGNLKKMPGSHLNLIFKKNRENSGRNREIFELGLNIFQSG